MKVTIEKLVYGGDGLARLPAEGGRAQTVFIPFVLPGEEVEIGRVQTRKGFGRAQNAKVLAASPQRIEPGCQYFYSCGGCHYQHADHDYQLAQKREIFLEAVRRGTKRELDIEVQTHSAEPWHYRNRTRMHVAHAPFKIGYYRTHSRDLLAIKQCPISSPLINTLLQAIWESIAQHPLPPSLQEVEFFCDHADSAVLLEFYGEPNLIRGHQRLLEEFCVALQAKHPALQGAAYFTAGDFSGKRLWSWGAESMQYKIGADTFRVQAGSFFQTNRHLAAKLSSLATQGLSGESAFDLYAGTGLFTLPLSRGFAQVHAVESSPLSFDDLKRNAPANVIPHAQETLAFLNKIKEEPDAIVVDPPRAGLGAEVASAIALLAPAKFVYVSCDPATLSRDLLVLLESGYSIREVHLLDMFPQTFHMESVVRLEKKD